MNLLFTDHDAEDIQFEVRYSPSEMGFLYSKDEIACLIKRGSVESDARLGNHNTVYAIFE